MPLKSKKPNYSYFPLRITVPTYRAAVIYSLPHKARILPKIVALVQK
jgi:hypothetical protein